MKFLILFLFIPILSIAQDDSLTNPTGDIDIINKTEKGKERTFLKKDNPTIQEYHNRKLRLENQSTIETKVYHTRPIIINTTGKKLKFFVKDLTIKNGDRTKITLNAGDTLHLGNYETTDGYDQLSSHFYIQAASKKRRIEFAAKSEDSFPEGDLFNRLGIIQLYRLTD